MSGCAGVVGRMLFTNNYYASIEVMKFLFLTYGILMVGTFKLTKKKSRTAADFPCRKLSNLAVRMVKQGLIRAAFMNIFSGNNSNRR